MKDVPVEAEYYEKQDFTKNRDYIFHLLMPDDFNQSLRHSIDISIDKFLYEYILYEWLKTKSPQDAVTYLESANDALKDVKTNLEVYIIIEKGSTFYLKSIPFGKDFQRT